MSASFADTFFFLALWNPRDFYHEQTLGFSRGFRGTLVTTRWILVEVADGLAATTERRFVKGLLDRVEAEPSVVIVGFDELLYQRGLTLYHSRADKAWSLTDCISFVVMAREGIREAR